MFGRGNSNWKVKSCAKSFLVFSFEGKKVVNKGSPSLFQFSLLLSHAWKQLLFTTFTAENGMRKNWAKTVKSNLWKKNWAQLGVESWFWLISVQEETSLQKLGRMMFYFFVKFGNLQSPELLDLKVQKQEKVKSPTAKIFGDERLVLWLATVQSNYKCCWSFCRLTFLIQTA